MMPGEDFGEYECEGQVMVLYRVARVRDCATCQDVKVELLGHSPRIVHSVTYAILNSKSILS